MSTAAPGVAGAGGETTAPAAGTQEAVNAASSFDTAAETILDFNPQEATLTEAAPIETKPAADAPAAATEAAKPADQTATSTEPAKVAAVDPWAIDQALLEKGLANPELSPLIKAMQTQLAEAAKWREFFPTVEDAQSFKALAPGGVEELKGQLEIARNAQQENADFFSGDPARQKSALESIANENPEAFTSGLPAYLDLVAAKNPEAFQKAALDMAMRGLQAERVPEMWDAFVQAVNGDDDAKTGEAFKAIASWMQDAGLSKATAKTAAAKAPNPELAKAQERIKELETTQHQAKVESFKTWWEPTNSEVSKAVRGDIQKRIDEFLPKNTPTVFREDLMARITDQVESEVTAQMRADAGHQQKLADVLKGEAWKSKGEEARKQYVNLTTGRATQLLPFVVAKVMEPYTKAAVASASAKNEKEQAQVARKDVSGGGGAPVKPAAPISVKDMKGKGHGKQLTDEQILEM